MWWLENIAYGLNLSSLKLGQRERLSILNNYKYSNNVSCGLNKAVVFLGSSESSDFEILYFKLNAAEFKADFRKILLKAKRCVM